MRSTSTRVDDDPNQPLTHYQILKVATAASSNEIKDAYHALARLHHPDRKRAERNDSSTSAPSSTDFLRIQKAWECLREGETRKLYDQSLLLQKHRVKLLYQNAIRLRPDECREVVVSNESVLSGESNHAIGDDDRYIELFYQCRCGSDINTSLLASLDCSGFERSPSDDISMDIVYCPGCSLIYDVGLLYVDDNDSVSLPVCTL